MKIFTITAAALLTLLLAPSIAGAAPQPRPGPDLPAATPRIDGAATVSANRICPTMRRLARSGNSRPALMVKNLGSGKSVCGLNARGSRSLASNMKVFTTVTSLARLGPRHRFRTRLFADGRINARGVLRGNLFLKGGGDPSLGQKDFLSGFTAGAGSEIEKLAIKAKRAGIRKVTGRLFGDDTVFDRKRGVADSGYGTSPWIGPLSGLSINAGYTSASVSRFSSNPARLATRTLVRELRRRGISIRPEIALKKTPRPAHKNLVARQVSENMTWMSRITNLNSNNFFAEMLLKNLGAELRN
ncbi:MAG: D-alanyl-D-alanine carboxypeptidase, partial [Actinomycetota bacterium]|nr:D-alanyl-D-alanine carboxypeptidase [Actinomycetota bacterium]